MTNTGHVIPNGQHVSNGGLFTWSAVADAGFPACGSILVLL